MRARVLLVGTLAAMLLSAGAAQAMPLKDLANGCNAKAAFGYQFGSQPAPEATLTAEGNDKVEAIYPVNGDAGPFKKIELTYGLRGGVFQLYEVTVDITYFGEGEPKEKAAELVAYIRKDGKFFIDESSSGDYFPYVPEWGPAYVFFSDKNLAQSGLKNITDGKGQMLQIYSSSLYLHISCINVSN